jgi:hypothetical protein
MFVLGLNFNFTILLKLEYIIRIAVEDLIEVRLVELKTATVGVIIDFENL